MDFIKGMDISSLDEVERCGGRFFDHGKEDDCIAILKSYGTNMVRIRLWNDPYDEAGNSYSAGGNDLACVKRLAKRALDAGIDWCLDFHYSDCWTDPGKQRVPKAWRGLDEKGLTRAVGDFTRETLEELTKEGLAPQMVAVGNEITNGLLWPYGQKPNWDNIVSFLNAGIGAVRDWNSNVPVMIHLDNGGNNPMYRDWFDNYFSHGGANFDYMGMSYYPFWHGSLEDLAFNMSDMVSRYHKDIIIAEVSMGFTLEDYKDYEKLPDEKRKGMATTQALADKVPFAMTEDGQKEFMEAFLKTVESCPENRGCGFMYWEPAWLPVPGSQWATEAAVEYMQEKGPGGNEWANQALFDYDGNALPALESIKAF